MSSIGLGYGATGHNSNSNNNGGSSNRNSTSGETRQSGEDVRILSVDPTPGGSSNAAARLRDRDDYFNSGSSQDALISADGLVPGIAGVRNRGGHGYGHGHGYGVNEKSPLSHQVYNSADAEQKDKDGKNKHRGCFHGPGERCSLPDMMQPLMSPLHHHVVENVVVKVRDSADVTQKTIFYFWDEWKLFVNRGNVIDLGIGVVIGGAFSDIIDSFVADILTPPLSLWVSGTNLENSFFVLKHGRTAGKVYATYLEAQADGAVTENTGHFLKACLNFVVIAFFLFWLVKAVHNVRKEKIRPPPKEKTCNWCREDIALEAFRCRFCQSFVKDIPGIEDAGVGMFVTVKRPKPQAQSPSQSGEIAGSPGGPPLTGVGARAGSATPTGSTTPGSKDGKKTEKV